MPVDQRMGRSGQGRPMANIYLMSWVAVAAFGLGYIGVAATRPELLGSFLPLIDQPQEQVVAGRTGADIADELATLRKWMHDLQHDQVATKSALQEQAVATGSLSQRVAAAEERLGTTREVRADVASRAGVQRLPPSRVQAPVPVAQPPRVAQAPPIAGEAATGTGGVKVINGGVAPIETGSVPDAAVTAQVAAAPAVGGFGQPKVVAAPPSGPRAVEIGSSESLDGLRAKWGDLTSRNGDVLADLAPRYRLAADGRQAPFTLLAGPFETPADATRACTVLRAKGVSCRVSAYGGNAF